MSQEIRHRCSRLPAIAKAILWNFDVEGSEKGMLKCKRLVFMSVAKMPLEISVRVIAMGEVCLISSNSLRLGELMCPGGA